MVMFAGLGGRMLQIRSLVPRNLSHKLARSQTRIENPFHPQFFHILARRCSIFPAALEIWDMAL